MRQVAPAQVVTELGTAEEQGGEAQAGAVVAGAPPLARPTTGVALQERSGGAPAGALAHGSPSRALAGADLATVQRRKKLGRRTA